MPNRAPERSLSWPRRLLAEWPRVVAALLLAGGLWLVVRAEEPVQAWVNVRLAITTDSAISLATTPAPVQAFVAGTRRDLLKLLSSPATMQRAITDESGDSARLELRVQDVDVASAIQLVVRDVRPRLLVLPLVHKNGSVTSRRDEMLDSIANRATRIVRDSLRRDSLRADSLRSRPISPDSLELLLLRGIGRPSVVPPGVEPPDAAD